MAIVTEPNGLVISNNQPQSEETQADPQTKSPVTTSAIGPDVEKKEGASEFADESKPNLLHNYASYTYNLSLHVLTPDDYTNLMNSPEKYEANHNNVLIASAGRRGDKVFQRNPHFNEDFFFEKFEMETVIGCNAQAHNANVINFNFTVIEPYGMTLMNRIVKLALDIANGNYTQLPYLIQIDFFGYTDDGKPSNGPIPKMTKILPIQILEIKMKVSQKGTEYGFSAAPFNHQAFQDTLVQTPINLEVTAGNLKDFFQATSSSLESTDPPAESAEDKQIRDSRSARTSAIAQAADIQQRELNARSNNNPKDPGIREDRDRVAALKATLKNEALTSIVPVTDDPAKIKSYTRAINIWHKDLVDGNTFLYADEIHFHFDDTILAMGGGDFPQKDQIAKNSRFFAPPAEREAAAQTPAATTAPTAATAPGVVGSTNVIASIVTILPKGTLTVKRPDGTIEKLEGDRNWRNNNPGNIEYSNGSFVLAYGALGSDGRFAIFPSYEAGRKAQEGLLFEGKNYKDLLLTAAITRWAPPSDNNKTATYQNTMLAAVGGTNKKMSEYSASERTALLNAMQKVEGYHVGSVTQVSSDNTTAAVAQTTAPTASATTATEPAAGKQNGQITQMLDDKDHGTIITMTINKGTSVNEVVNLAVGNSRYVFDQMLDITGGQDKITVGKVKEWMKKPLNWFRIIPRIKLKEFDTMANRFAKSITYLIVPHTIYNTKTDEAPAGQPTKYLKNYQYIFSGHNDDIISCDLIFDTTYYCMKSANPTNQEILGQKAKEAPSESSETDDNQRVLTKTEVQDLINENKKGIHELKYRKAVTGGQTGNALQKGSMAETVKQVSNNIMSPSGDMISVKLKIIGDPDFIKQDDIFFGPGDKKSDDLDRTPNGSLITDTGEIFCRLSFKTPSDYDPVTGLAIPGTGGYTEGIFSGIYRILSVKSSFANGKFEQELDLVRYQNQTTPGLQQTPSATDNTTRPVLTLPAGGVRDNQESALASLSSNTSVSPTIIIAEEDIEVASVAVPSNANNENIRSALLAEVEINSNLQKAELLPAGSPSNPIDVDKINSSNNISKFSDVGSASFTVTGAPSTEW